ncbi:MAG: hypothetical protein RDU20_01280 [Desulfomonilaceae bacterium]|nr:hypothetical protein [Desulfomonilaceae bacterium]
MAIFSDTSCIPRLLVTAVGSLPHEDPYQAVEMITTHLGNAAHAPQLSRCDPREQMWIQFTENLPGFQVDLENLRYYFDTSTGSDARIEQFFSNYLDVLEGGSPEYFRVGRQYGRGIHALLDRLKENGKKLPFLKVQVTGPLSFALTVTDENGKPIFYHPVYRDVAVKAMGLKAVWLLEEFKPYAQRIIVFFDEPSLSAYGSSAFLGVSKDDVIESLNDVISMVVSRDGIPGVHCCGNTDWSLLMETSTSIINFDAVDYMETMAIYRNELIGFLARGGVLAWGAVPNTERIRGETVSDVIERVRAGVDMLVHNGVERDALTGRVIVTPACGCAGLAVEDTQRVYGILSELESLGPDHILGK